MIVFPSSETLCIDSRYPYSPHAADNDGDNFRISEFSEEFEILSIKGDKTDFFSVTVSEKSIWRVFWFTTSMFVM